MVNVKQRKKRKMFLDIMMPMIMTKGLVKIFFFTISGSVYMSMHPIQPSLSV